MGKTQYQKCLQLLKECEVDEITFDELIRLIKIKVGNDKYRVVRPVFELMLDSILIEEIEHARFRILCR